MVETIGTSSQRFWHHLRLLLLSGKEPFCCMSSRIVVPRSLHEKNDTEIDCTRDSKESCVADGRLRTRVWWPGASQEISHMVDQCPDIVLKLDHD